MEPCGADAFGAPSKKNSTGTCRIWDICCNRLGPHAVGAVLVFLHLLEGEAECGTKLLLAYCKHLAAHPHPPADMLVDGVRRIFRGKL